MKPTKSSAEKSRRGKFRKAGASTRKQAKQDAPTPSELETIDLAEINPDPANRPIDLTQARFRGIKAAIRERGVLSPIAVVEKDGGGYDLIDGHLRFAVLKRQGVESIQAVVFSDQPSEKQLRADQIMFNTPSQRTPFEMAGMFQRLVDACGGSQANAGRMVGETPQTISKYLALKRIGPQLQAEIERFNSVQDDQGSQPLTFNHTYEIALAKSTSEQKRLAGLAMGGATTKKLSKERKSGPPSAGVEPDADYGTSEESPLSKSDQHAQSANRAHPVNGPERVSGGANPTGAQKLPLVNVALGDYEEMALDLVDWRPALEKEPKQCIAVGLRLAALDPDNNAHNWPKDGIRMTWKGKVKSTGQVRFLYRNGRVYLRLREPVPTVRRKAILIAAIYTGETLQTWH